MKFDKEKPPMALIPPEPLYEVADVFRFGAEKYGMNNWRDDVTKQNGLALILLFNVTSINFGKVKILTLNLVNLI